MTAPGADGAPGASPGFMRAAGSLLARRGEVIQSQVVGTSMGRTLPLGTAIRIRSAAGSACRPGDIVTFVAGRSLVTHRMVARGRRAARQGFLITRGDGTWLCDPPVADDLVVGVVTEWEDRRQWRSVAELPPMRASSGAALFARAMVLALDVHLWAARSLYIVAHLGDRIAGPLRRAGRDRTAEPGTRCVADGTTPSGAP